MAETKIAKGECRDKRKFYFRFGYAEPQPIFVPTKIAKGERRDKRKPRFRFGYTEPQPILVCTKIVQDEYKKQIYLLRPSLYLTQPKIRKTIEEKMIKPFPLLLFVTILSNKQIHLAYTNRRTNSSSITIQ